MKRIGLWKRIVGWLLAVLLVIQIPVSVFAEEWVSNDASVDTDFTETEKTNYEEEENISFYDDENIKEKEIEGFTNSEKKEQEEQESFSDGTEVFQANEEQQEIQVIVSISKDGDFLTDKDGKPMAGRIITLTGKSSYTMNDALNMAHELYYPGGATEGYDFHDDENGIMDGLIYKLWGYNKNDVPAIRFSLNQDNQNYKASLTRNIENGDEMHFYIQQTKGVDKLAYFTEREETVTENQDIQLTLRQTNNSGSSNSFCEGAEIYIDGIKLEGSKTDQNGTITIPALPAREQPYFITAKKTTINADGTINTDITATYTRVTVVTVTEQPTDYVQQVKLEIENGNNKFEKKVDVQDANKAFVIPTEYRSGSFYISTEKENLPENSEIFAVYSNLTNGTTCRVKLAQNGTTFLKNTSVSLTKKAIHSIRIEVRKNGNLLQNVEIPIRYKDHLTELSVWDSWGHEIDTGMENNLESQKLEILVPRNSAYVDISGWSSGYGVSVRKCIQSEETEFESASGGRVMRFVPDWDAHQEYTITISLLKNDSLNISDDTIYTLVIKPGDNDYTPDVSLKIVGKYGSIVKDSSSTILNVQATALEQEFGTFSYQWYYFSLPEGIYVPEYVPEEQYIKIEGATEASYTVSTDQEFTSRYYCCIVTYTINEKKYSKVSDFTRFAIVSDTVDSPEIDQQPQDKVYVIGKVDTEPLSITLKKSVEPGIVANFQWYKNDKRYNTDGIRINGATQSTYQPSASEEGTIYYYCEVWYEKSWKTLESGKDPETFTVESVKIVSNPVAVSVIEEPLPWEGDGSEAAPYKIGSVSDLEVLRDKVNVENFSFENTYFLLSTDIILPNGWKPIGVTKNGRVDLEKGENLNAFSGIFDGDGHTITVPEGGLPLFGYVKNTRIRNLNIYGTKIAGYGLVNNFEGVGLSGCAVEIDNVTLKSGSSTLKSGLIGANKTMSPYAGCSAAFVATITNCTIEKGVVIGYDKKQRQIGAIAGRMQGTIKNCVSYADVYGTDYVGGIIGTRDNAMGTCSVIGSEFYGTVIASGQHAGGIVGGGYDSSSAPNGTKVTINNCVSEGTVTGADKVGGILGGDTYVAQTWDNCQYSLRNNSFTGKVQATGENASYIGGIIGFYDSLNRIDAISNNYYSKDCGATRGIGFVKYIDTSNTSHETSSGSTYFNTENGTTDCPDVNGCGWKTGYNRTDDPLGADMDKLFSTEGLRITVDSLELSGDYRTAFDIGEDLDFTGMQVKALISDGTEQEIQWTDLTIEGYNKNQRGEQTLKLSYKEAFTQLTVTVLKKNAGTITVSLTLLGDSVHNSDTDGTYHTLYNGNLETWIKKTDYKIDGNANVLAVLKTAFAENNMTYRSAKEENYIAGITRAGEAELAEFTNGDYSGWMYTLNGIHSDLGVKEQYLEDGDEIVFHYTDDYRKEHEHEWSESWSYDSESHWHECVSRYGTCDIIDNTKKGGYQKHTFGDGKVITAATCKAEGKKEFTCLVCGYTKTEVIPKTSQHSYDTGTVTKQATYTAAGEKVYTCTVCGATKTEVIPMLTHDHNFTWTVISQATVFVPEKQEGICTICGAKKTRDNGSKLTATMKLNVTSIKLQKKQSTTKVKVTGLANGDSVKTWTSSNKKIVTVDKNGKIKAGKKTGNAKITVTLKSGKKATLKVKVQSAKVKTTKLTGLKTRLTLKKGKSLTLKPVVAPITSQEKVTYTTSNKKVATVTKNGVIKAKKKGTATITVKSGKITKKIKVTVR